MDYVYWKFNLWLAQKVTGNFMLGFDEQVLYGRLIKRYKRFFIDALLPDGQKVVTHVPNTGSMLGLIAPESLLLLTKSQDPKRKTAYTTQAIEVDGSLVGVNTHLPNQLIKNSLAHPLLAHLIGYREVRSEVRDGLVSSRIDFFFSHHPMDPPLYLEIKNVTMKNGTKAQFPDAVSLRAQKHLLELIRVKEQGFKAELLFVVQRQDCQEFEASSIDLEYKKLLFKAYQAGVSIRALCASIGKEGLKLTHEIPCRF